MQLLEGGQHSRLSKKVAEESKSLRYGSLSHKELCIFCYIECNMHYPKRQMRGEELQGLTVDELQQLEKSLDAGLHQVIEKKVSSANWIASGD